MRIIATGLEFPEGPVAMSDGSLLFVELARETVSRVDRSGKVEIVAKVPGGPNGLALGPKGLVYICNNGGFSWVRENGTLRTLGQREDYSGGSIDVLDLSNGKVECLYNRCGKNGLCGPNDLVFDEFGGFWFTDYGKRRERDWDRNFVYWARADGSEIVEVIGPLITPNGIGLSPDGKTLYVAETETARLWAWEVIGPGSVRKMPWPSPAGGKLVTGLGGYSRFDSLAVTASGNVCVAALHRCAIAVVSPSGADIGFHSVPDLQVTNLCFGGNDMRRAFVTMSHGGKICEMEWDEPGLKLNYSE